MEFDGTQRKRIAAVVVGDVFVWDVVEYDWMELILEITPDENPSSRCFTCLNLNSGVLSRFNMDMDQSVHTLR